MGLHTFIGHYLVACHKRVSYPRTYIFARLIEKVRPIRPIRKAPCLLRRMGLIGLVWLYDSYYLSTGFSLISKPIVAPEVSVLCVSQLLLSGEPLMVNRLM